MILSLPHFLRRVLARCLTATLVCAFLSTEFAHGAIPAFPGAEGYGAYAAGGRNGDVYHVTNLNSSGVGSFADAIATVPSAGRTIVFDVSGYIRFPSGADGTRLTASKVTIAGQTAPGDGIGFYNNFFRISGDDIVVRHVRFRMGYYGSGGDCVDLDSGCLNAVLDHVSMEFSTDENMSSFSSPPENLTLQWSLNAWGLETHSCGGLWDQSHATSHHNLWAYNHTRNPKSRPSGLLEWINNVTYDWDIGFIMGDTTSVANYKANVVGSYFISPPGNTQSKAFVKATVATNNKPNFSLYLSNCLHDSNGDGLLNGADKGYSIVEGTAYDPAGSDSPASGSLGYYKYTTPFANTGSLSVTTDAPLVAYKKVVSNAGALRLDSSYNGSLRDEVDSVLFSRVVSQVHTSYSGQTGIRKESDTGASNGGFGSLISDAAPIDTDRDGMPDYYETALGWNASADDHATALANNGSILTGTTFFPANTPAGYTRLEEYLHFLAIPHGTLAKNVSGSPTSLTIDLRKFTSGFSASPVFTIANVIGGSVAQSGTGGCLVTFTPTLNYTGRGRFEFTVTDAEGSAWTQTFGILVSVSGLPRDLVWKGDGSANSWDASTNNWLLNGSAAVFSSGDYATFDDTGSKSPAVNVGGASASCLLVDASGNYTFGGNGAISTSGPLTKRGTGTLTLLNPSNSFASATVEAGSLVLGVGGGIGGGKVTLLDATTFSNLYSASQPTVPVSFEVPAGNTATINTGNRLILSGSLLGAGTLNCNVQTSVTRVDLKGPTSAFSGNLNFTGGGGVRLYFNGGSFNGFDQAKVDVGGSVSLQPQTNSGGNTLNIGALSGASASANLAGGSAGTVAYVVDGLGGDTSFAGNITGNATLTKTGGGSLTLGGLNNSYTGATSVNSGGMLVSGTLASSPVTVASGACFGGGGTLGGALVASAGATLSPGTAPSTGATLTLNGGLTLAGANTLNFHLSASPAGANDKIAMNGGTLAMSGTQNFQFTLLTGTIGPGNYDLITGATNSTFTSVSLTHNLPGDTRQSFALSRSSAGANPSYVRLTVTGNSAALAWTGSSNGGTWDAQATTNWSGGPTATFFNGDTVTFSDGAATGSVNLASSVAPRILTVDNNSLAYTFSGTGSIAGAGQLIKSGLGLLTIGNNNSYLGGTTINPGSTIALANDIANASGLGTGLITFNGGTLSMYSNSSSYNSASYSLSVPAGQTGRLNADARCDLYGTLVGSGTLNFFIPWIRTTLFTDWSAFSGAINVITDGDGGDVRMGTNYWFPGFPRATVNLADKVWAYYIGTLAQGAGTTIEIGELSGGSLSGLMGGATGGRNFTYRIGGKTPVGSEVLFAGTITEQSSSTTTSFVKTGAGTWTLSGACRWNGGTTIEQGTLKVSGSMGCGAALAINSGATLNLAGGSVSADTVNVQAGATLTGRGTLDADLTNDGTITSPSGGQLTITGDVVNNGTMRLSGGTALNATGAFTNNGVLDLLTGSGALPANLVNNGLVIDSSAVKLKSYQKSGNVFTLTVDSYTGHNYKLQRSSTLGSAASWQDVGAVQAGATHSDGTPSVLTFADSNATGTSWFYRVQISP